MSELVASAPLEVPDVTAGGGNCACPTGLLRGGDRMTLLVVGINHRSAPLRVLDEVGLSHDDADGLAADLAASEVVAEALVLATCNRVEVYADVTRFHPAVTTVADLMAKWTGTDRGTLIEHSYVHFDSAAVAHLFSVASGLDSMVVGEAQILGQVRASLGRGQDSGTAGRVLNGVGQQALRVGKRVHAETGIDRSGVSVVSVALDAAEEVLGDLADRRVLLVGAGSMGALAASTLAARGARAVLVANRTTTAAQRVAAVIPGGRAVDLTDLPETLAQVDLAILCTGAQDSVVELPTVIAARQGVPAGQALVLLDLALPHDVAPEVGDLPGVTLIDLATLGTPAGIGWVRGRCPGSTRDRRRGGAGPPRRCGRPAGRASARLAARPRRWRPGRGDGPAAAAAHRPGRRGDRGGGAVPAPGHGHPAAPADGPDEAAGRRAGRRPVRAGALGAVRPRSVPARVRAGPGGRPRSRQRLRSTHRMRGAS